MVYVLYGLSKNIPKIYNFYVQSFEPLFKYNCLFFLVAKNSRSIYKHFTKSFAPKNIPYSLFFFSMKFIFSQLNYLIYLFTSQLFARSRRYGNLNPNLISLWIYR